MRFSIIVPVYNVEAYLADCLESLLRQDFDDWEAICVNDGSTDSSARILDGYASRDSRIRIINQPNGGLSAARNTGLDAATGDYILFLDSDDWLENNTLSCLSNHLDNADMICFGGWMGSKEESPAQEAFDSGWSYYNRHAIEHHEFPFVCVVLRCYRRKFLEDNTLRFRVGILHEDNHFTPRACLVAKEVKVIPYSFYHYRIRPGSIMTTRSFRSRQDMLRIANDLAAIFTQRNNLDRSVVYRAITNHYQVAFVGANRNESKSLQPLVDWHLYRTVSRTRVRHRINYALIRISPTLFSSLSSNTNG